MIKVDLHNRPMYEYRCDERLKGKDEESSRITYTGFQIETRLIDERFASVMGEFVI